jgi:glycosyltransferase involved in cell wall biosynthesis
MFFKKVNTFWKIINDKAGDGYGLCDFLLRRRGVYFIYDGFKWAIYWEGYYIALNIKQHYKINCRLVSELRFMRNQIIHFGYQFEILGDKYKKLHKSNSVVLTCMHGSRNDPNFTTVIDYVINQQNRISYTITPCTIMYQRLIEYGFKQEKVIKIPIGVDLDRFFPLSLAERNAMRKHLGIKPEHIVIGSFQKDGVGWQEGLEPKLIKGPDIFLKVVGSLIKRFPIFVLVIGPARGYVKKGLERLGIPYSYFDVPYEKIAPYYHALDFYLISSREEGGPHAVLESMASGVPLVSTRVGMANDIIRDGENGFINEVEDIDGLTKSCEHLIASPEIRNHLINNGLRTSRNYDWKDIAIQYYEKVYKPLLMNNRPAIPGP